MSDVPGVILATALILCSIWLIGRSKEGRDQYLNSLSKDSLEYKMYDHCEHLSRTREICRQLVIQSEYLRKLVEQSEIER